MGERDKFCHIYGMTSRVDRVEALKTLLADRDYTTAAELAAELGVSVRTLHRDLTLLRNLGMPMDSDGGRGGGLRLEHGWSLGRVHLNESEAIGLLLSLTVTVKLGSPLLLEDARPIARKIAMSFAPVQARRILALRKRILLGAPASSQVLSTYTAPPTALAKRLLDAFIRQRHATIRYTDQSGRATERDIELQCLYYNVPVGYALAWDGLRQDVRFFRFDRITKVHLLDTKFRLRPASLFLQAGEPDAQTL